MTRLDVIEQVISCTDCGLHERCNAPVAFSGPVPAKVAVVGEAPGGEEDKAGQPFIGPAGKLLRAALADAGLNPDDLFICNTVSCYPGRTPNADEMAACEKNKTAQLELAQPAWVLLAGAVALNGFRPDLKIGKARGRPFCPTYPEPPVYFATYHPAAALRNKLYEHVMVEDLAVFAEMVRSDRVPFISSCVWCGRAEKAMDVWHGDRSGITYCERCWSRCPPDWQRDLPK